MPNCSYSGAADNLRVPTGVAAAQGEGFTGKGVKVAILDTERVDGYAPLNGRITAYSDFTGKPADSSEAGKSGHGALMTALVGGSNADGFNGGAAPQANLYWGRVCAEDACASDTITKGVAHHIAAGVRLFNLSLGSAGSAASANAYRAMADYIVSGDALLVAATGNAGREQPDNPAGLPAYLPQYRNNWLAVANVRIDHDGQPAGLHALSNACGDAAAFCLAAPGLHQVTPVAGTAFANSHHVDGTSASTAVVTGAAALVWQAFPWMSASNVQQTLLTTARDLGAAGVDPLYGWGMLDVGAAVHGPAQFTKDFSADLAAGQHGDFSHDISGKGGLIKRGNGQLALSGNNSYSGTTMVEAGTLQLSGNIAGDLQLANRAWLQSAGGVIGGDFTAGSQATTAIALGQPLQVSGQANLSGTLHLQPGVNGYVPSSTETVLGAGSIDGRFSSVSYANDLFWQASLDYSSQQVVAQLSRTSATTSALSLAAPAAVINGATQADTLLAGLEQHSAVPGSGNPAPIMAGLQGILLADNTQAAASLASLSAPLLGMEHQASLADDLRQLSLLADQQHLHQHDERSMWAEGLYQQGSLSQPGYGSARWHSEGFQGGINLPSVRQDQHWGLGLSATEMSLRAPLGDRSRGRHVRAYAWWQGQWQHWQLSTIAGYGRSRVDNHRHVIAGQNSEMVSSRRRDGSALLRVDLGWKATPWLQPYLAAGLVRQDQGRFNEQSDFGLGLLAASQQRSLPFAETGLRFEHDAGKWQWRGTWGYQRLLDDRALDYTAAFDGAQQLAIDVAGLKLPAERWRLSLQGRWQLTRQLAIQGSVHGQLESGAGRDSGANLGLQWRF